MNDFRFQFVMEIFTSNLEEGESIIHTDGQHQWSAWIAVTTIYFVPFDFAFEAQ